MVLSDFGEIGGWSVRGCVGKGERIGMRSAVDFLKWGYMCLVCHQINLIIEDIHKTHNIICVVE